MKTILLTLLTLTTLLSAQNLKDITYTLEIQSTNNTPITEQQIKKTTHLLKSRLSKQDIPEESLSINEKTITLKLTNINQDLAKNFIQNLIKPTSLTIHEVHLRSGELAEKVQKGEIPTPEGYETKQQQIKNQKGEIIANRPVLIKTVFPLSEADIETASPDYSTNTMVNIELTNEGGKIMETFTRGLEAGRSQIATVLDGKILIVATLQAEVLSKRFQISGLDNLGESKALAYGLTQPKTTKLKITKTQITPTKK